MKKYISMFICIFTTLLLTSCIQPFDTPEFVEITPSQTVYLVPLIGKTEDQVKFDSEEFLEKSKIPSKRIQIPHEWVKTGRGTVGKYLPTMRAIVVERKPVTREWTELETNGTSNKNEGIVAESKESIGFMARMNCNAQIDEKNVTLFLYRYNNKPLEEIIDSEVRTRIESKFVEECAKRDLATILLEKAEIMKVIRDDATPFFNERGITITVLGLKGEFTYLNNEIQRSIDAKFKSAQDVITQGNENLRVVSKAEADNKAIKTQADTIQYSIKLKELDIMSKWIEKWNGNPPSVVGGGSSYLFNMPNEIMSKK